MQLEETAYKFPDGASPRDRVLITLQYPSQFVRWCRTRVGLAPNIFIRRDSGCVVEQYLREVTGVRTVVGLYSILVCVPRQGELITPTWVQRVVAYVDDRVPAPTYNDVANMLMAALERNEVA